jgi:TonB family protein
MSCRSIAKLLLFCSCGLVTAHAQQVIQVTAKMIQEHTDHRVFPFYPPIAKAARVQGTVVLDLRIGTTGRIESIKVVNGPPMLQQAAIDCVKQWTFHPFEKDGIPVVATGQYNIIFTLGDQSSTTVSQGSPPSTSPTSSASVKTVTVRVLSDNAANGPDEELNKKFDDADDACKKGILSKQFNDDTVSKCQRAAMLADELPMDGNYIAKRSAYVYAASAYADIGNFKSAFPWAIKAVDVVKLGHDGDSGSSAAYEDKGIIEGNLEDLAAADQDLTAAENYERKGIIDTEKGSSNISENYKRILARDLRYHAKVLQGLNLPGEAQKKLDEADQLMK